MNIYVPSRKRAIYSFLHGAYSVLRWLTPELSQRTYYVVRDEEVDAYKKLLDPHGVKVLACGQPANLSEKRDWIAKSAMYGGEDKFLMCDDDVMLYIRKSADVWNLRYPQPDEVNDLFVELEMLLDFYPMVGLSPREGNNRIGAGDPPLIQECTRSMRMYGFRTDDYLSIEANRLSEMADFDTTLQMLRKGLKNAVLYYWAQGQPGSQYTGGCSIYRTTETHEAICRKLQELHPDYVKLRQKTNKGEQHGFGTRTEVTVQWKKAYNDANHRT